jgi:hypothetical protein
VSVFILKDGVLKTACLGLFSSFYGFLLPVAFRLVPDLSSFHPQQWFVNAQAVALQHGRLALSEDPRFLGFDVVWFHGCVQQVWGLLLPFWIAFLSFVTGIKAEVFPTRVALSIALSLTAFQVLNTVVNEARTHLFKKTLFSVYVYSAPAVVFVLLSPAIVGLLKSPFLIYEEVILYSYLVGLLIGLALLDVWNGAGLIKILWLALLCGIAPLMRPTLIAYSLPAFSLAFLALKARRTSRLVKYGFVGLFTLCLLLTPLTNLLRFGATLEFGHSLNLSHHSRLLCYTRFNKGVSCKEVITGIPEVFGALLFDEGLGPHLPDADSVFAWQSTLPRWRDNYLHSLGWPFVLFIIVGYLGCRIWRVPTKSSVIYAYAFAAFFLLIVFYSSTPVLASRYLYDIGASLMLSACFIWTELCGHLCNKNQVVVVSGLAILVVGYCVYRNQEQPEAVNSGISLNRAAFIDILKSSPIGRVDVYNHSNSLATISRDRASVTHMGDRPIFAYDSQGWDSASGEVDTVTTHYVVSPEFLIVRGRLAAPGPQALPPLRARIGLEELQKRSEVVTGTSFEITFAPPKCTLCRAGLQVLFLCWKDPPNIRTCPPIYLNDLRWKD